MSLLGCVSQPKEPKVNIEPNITYVSPDRYEKYNCVELLEQTKGVLDKLGYLDTIHETHSNRKSSVSTDVSIILAVSYLWPPALLSLMNGGGSYYYNDSRYPILRGEIIALKTIADKKECDIDSFINSYHKVEEDRKAQRALEIETLRYAPVIEDEIWE